MRHKLLHNNSHAVRAVVFIVPLSFSFSSCYKNGSVGGSVPYFRAYAGHFTLRKEIIEIDLPRYSGRSTCAVFLNLFPRIKERRKDEDVTDEVTIDFETLSNRQYEKKRNF